MTDLFPACKITIRPFHKNKCSTNYILGKKNIVELWNIILFSFLFLNLIKAKFIKKQSIHIGNFTNKCIINDTF